MIFSPSRALGALAFLASALVSSPVLAHAHLKQQTPAADSVVSASPQTIELRFSEGVEPAFSAVTLTGDRQRTVKTGPLTRDARDNTRLIIPLEEALTAGSWRVDWRVVSVDGHKTTGSYRFSVK